MSKGLLCRLADEFCYEILIDGQPKWLIKHFDLVSIYNANQVYSLCNQIKRTLPMPSTVDNLSAKLTKFMSSLAFIIAEIENTVQTAQNKKKSPDVFH